MVMNGDVWKTAFVGIGSNLEGPKNQVLNAIEALDARLQCSIVRCSSLYSTEPIGLMEQPEFINAVCKISTSLSPVELLQVLLDLENSLGRVRTGLINGPRSIDLDLLLYECEIHRTDFLTLPHPRMHERRFVLQPLVELDRLIEIPNRGKAIELIKLCTRQKVIKLQ